MTYLRVNRASFSPQLLFNFREGSHKVTNPLSTPCSKYSISSWHIVAIVCPFREMKETHISSDSSPLEEQNFSYGKPKLDNHR